MAIVNMGCFSHLEANKMETGLRRRAEIFDRDIAREFISTPLHVWASSITLCNTRVRCDGYESDY